MAREIVERVRAEEERERLLVAERAQARRQAALFRLSAELAATLDEAEVYQCVVDDLHDTPGYDSVDLYLVDEPTAGLAKLLSKEVYQMLVDLRDQDGLTIILVDQEIRKALKVADYVYVLDLGRNKFDGPVEEFTDLEKAFWA